MGERWQPRRSVPPKPAAPRPLPARAPEADFIGFREVRTVLDQGTQVNGKLSFTAPTRIEGRLRGEVRATDLLEVGLSGVVHGSVWAKVLVVAGEIRGRVLGAERVEIQPGARVHGLVEARTLVVAEGALLDGDVRMMMHEDGIAELDEPARG
ncbi:MAG: polymer-forming cytoskeletal protein [Deltaproteobacteria bacterium]|nr:polymer-forming cytoskeletal protein [Deltaproteobacteria bacterium]